MKRFLIIAFLLFPLFATAQQELNQYGKAIKECCPELYSGIRSMAVDEWGSDHEMILHQINKQCEAYYEINQWASKLTMDDTDKLDIYWNAVLEWSDETDAQVAIENGKADWEMVWYTIQKQLEAMSQY